VKIKYFTAAIIAGFIFNSCAGYVSLKVPALTGGKFVPEKYVPKKPRVVFEDFEAGAVIGGYSYANSAGGASAKIAISEPGVDAPKSGNYAAKAVFNTGADPAWGCGFGFQSVYGGGFIDAADREYVSLWINAPHGMRFYIFVNEASANGADGEFWNSPDLTGAGEWKEYELELDLFYKNIYSGNQNGNNLLDTVGIGTVGLQVGGAQGGGEILIDDVIFK